VEVDHAATQEVERTGEAQKNSARLAASAAGARIDEATAEDDELARDLDRVAIPMRSQAHRGFGIESLAGIL
jgi:hypothetical protein